MTDPAAVPGDQNVPTVPNIFTPLIPFSKHGRFPMISIRDGRIRDAERVRLEELVNKVEPYFGSINQYLNSFGEAQLTDAAIALGELAEAAEEARQWLQTLADRTSSER